VSDETSGDGEKKRWLVRVRLPNTNCRFLWKRRRQIPRG
jgi:hypothetical protein